MKTWTGDGGWRPFLFKQRERVDDVCPGLNTSLHIDLCDF